MEEVSADQGGSGGRGHRRRETGQDSLEMGDPRA